MVEDCIDAFEHLAIRKENLTNELFKQCFISGLKEKIQAHIEMSYPWLNSTQSKCPNFSPSPLKMWWLLSSLPHPSNSTS
jgi:hypothetical protein